MDKELLEKHCNEGLSQRKIAQLLNVSKETVSNYLRKFNLKTIS